MNLLHYARLLNDPSIYRYLKSSIKEGRFERFFCIALSVMGGRRCFVPDGLSVAINKVVTRSEDPSIKGFYKCIPFVNIVNKNEDWVKINLASVSWAFNDGAINWAYRFDDIEDSMALHRFSWVLRGIEHGVPWSAINSWLDWMSDMDERPRPGWVMDSYTVSERICNFLSFLSIDTPKNDDLTQKVLKSVYRDSVFLAANLDYHGHAYTNNHILNNARALVFSGAYLQDNELFDLGVRLLKQQLPLHCSMDGVFREASSHYQWVITRWMVEVAIILVDKKVAGCEEFIEHVRCMLNCCDRLSLGYREKKYIPRIGDISPDYPPEWYGGMTETAHAILGSYSGEVSEKHLGNKGGWAGLFALSGCPELVNDSCWSPKNGDWIRLESGNWSLLAHSDTLISDNRTTHGHQDSLSFELAWKGLPVVIDRGRRDYRSPIRSHEAGILDEWHNSILINGSRIGFRPRGFMSPDWLGKRLPKPKFTVDSNYAKIVVDNSQGFIAPHIKEIERTWRIDGNEIKISTALSGIGVYDLRLFLVFPDSLIENAGETGFKLCSLDGDIIPLRWEGMTLSGLSTVECYPSYGVTKPCQRVEWSSKVKLPWEGSFILSQSNN